MGYDNDAEQFERCYENNHVQSESWSAAPYFVTVARNSAYEKNFRGRVFKRRRDNLIKICSACRFYIVKKIMVIYLLFVFVFRNSCKKNIAVVCDNNKLNFRRNRMKNVFYGIPVALSKRKL